MALHRQQALYYVSKHSKPSALTPDPTLPLLLQSLVERAPSNQHIKRLAEKLAGMRRADADRADEKAAQAISGLKPHKVKARAIRCVRGSVASFYNVIVSQNHLKVIAQSKDSS